MPSGSSTVRSRTSTLRFPRPRRRERPPGPVKVAWARNLAEAELIEGLLAAEGIPCLIQRTAAADVPDFLAAGPRNILVPASAAEQAAEILDRGDGLELPGE